MTDEPNEPVGWYPSPHSWGVWLYQSGLLLLTVTRASPRSAWEFKAEWRRGCCDPRGEDWQKTREAVAPKGELFAGSLDATHDLADVQDLCRSKAADLLRAALAGLVP